MANTPTYILYHGRNTGKDKDSKKIWTRIGAVWANKSGKGFNLTWDYLPLGDGLTVMLPFDKDEQDTHGRVPIFPIKLPAEHGVKWPSVSISSTAPLCSRTATGVWPRHWRDTKRDWALSSGD
jgi:hypothetical protein